MMMPQVFYIVMTVALLQLLLAVIFSGIYLGKHPLKRGKIEKLSVVIPFKNEEDRIHGLIDSINKVIIPKSMEVEFFFVDDHSTDNTAALLTKDLLKPHKILLNNGKGKKDAIDTAIINSQFDYILCWDADIRFNESYLNTVYMMAEADCWILPVRLKANNFIARLGSIEFDWMQILTFISVKFNKPLLSNGANFLFRKERYFQAKEIRSDFNIASGDDVFLLNAFKELHADIQVTKVRSIEVETDAPVDLITLFNQRKRWINKVFKMKSGISLLLGLFVSLIAIVPIVSIALSLVYADVLFLVPLFCKYLIEYLFLRMYNGVQNGFSDLGIVLIHQLFYPIYLFVLLFYKPHDERWEA
ncbi:glycosyltransferase [Paracrocinitomix mangrovi]|uniref:glycosyltransferase n=1 Tax=Paracrocinitomix mangrovi TaxID=2862509 RepID=UPI001C8F009C|nr:glycosyltransferase [Paracrocinitomix mangrovi]UKN00485.1 glycosyltransferase [Paracrocinitomix mangrovi]